MVAPLHSFGRRLGLQLGLLLAVTAGGRADPVINEFLASNSANLADDDGVYSDWIELFNPDAAAVNLNGWYLTDSANQKTRWQLPAVTLPAGGYLVIFASGNDRRDPTKPLHTNFSLSADGEYLALVKPDGIAVAHEYSPGFPAQSTDISYGLSQAGASAGQKGYFLAPTPGRINGAAATLVTETVSFSRTAGPFTNSFALALSGAAPGQRIRYVLAAPSASGAVIPEPAATSPEYTGPLTISSSVIIRATVFSSDGTSRGRPASAHYVKLGATGIAFTSQMPVLVLDNHGGRWLTKDGIDHPAWLYAFGVRPSGTAVLATAPDVATPITMSIRGASSSNFPKQPYNLKFADPFGAKRNQALFGSLPYEKWALIPPWFYDRTYIHNAFAYSLSNRIGRWAPRTTLTEVFFNNDGADLGTTDYVGIYALADRVEVGVDRVNIATLSSSDTGPSSITGGYILKIDLRDADEYGFSTARGIPEGPASQVVVAYPKNDELVPAQRDYIRNYVQAMENALFADQARGWATRTYLDYIDRPSWVDHHILNTFMGNVDAFTRSAYFTKDKNARLVAGPIWDFDRALGSADERNASPEGWMGDPIYDPDVWSSGWWWVLTKDPEFMQDWVDRWQSLRQGEFSNSSLNAQIDAWANVVDPAAATRDAARWPDNVSRYGNHAGEIAHMKSWTVQRAEWIDRQFVAAPTVAAAGASQRITPVGGAPFAYTVDGSDPRALGGEVAANAVISSVAVDVPATANVHARSYRAELKGVFPGNPWSSAAAGANASPLAPVSRLINISTRGVVGSGESALIAGVVVADTANKRYLSRAVGPGLSQFGVTGVVPDPRLTAFNNAGAQIYTNTGWTTGVDAPQLADYSRSVGAFPLVTGVADSALVASLTSAPHTLQVTTPTTREGIGLVELYELDASGRTLNLSTRGQVRTGIGALVGGFVVQGTAYKRMLIRAIGPGLSAFGLSGVLADPIMTVFSGQTVIATNDRWGASADAAAIEKARVSVGAFALGANSEDAAMILTVAPGPYTVEVRGKNNTQGVGLIEIYELP
ncbi:MAG TPA: CotH kinase family protein [Opitutaceae bacterium]|nr:CotH kinase family protein [Opitutaceae bacterium]